LTCFSLLTRACFGPRLRAPQRLRRSRSGPTFVFPL
jgi:hypothetical protein